MPQYYHRSRSVILRERPSEHRFEEPESDGSIIVEFDPDEEDELDLEIKREEMAKKLYYLESLRRERMEREKAKSKETSTSSKLERFKVHKGLYSKSTPIRSGKRNPFDDDPASDHE